MIGVDTNRGVVRVNLGVVFEGVASEEETEGLKSVSLRCRGIG